MNIRRVVAALLVGAASGVIAAVVIAILDIYLTGHGHAGLTRERFTWPSLGVYLSLGDLLMLSSVLVSAVAAWRLIGRND